VKSLASVRSWIYTLQGSGVSVYGDGKLALGTALLSTSDAIQEEKPVIETFK
jgi:hypothetical protein